MSIFKIFAVAVVVAWVVSGPSASVAAANTGIFKGACSGTSQGAICSANQNTTDPLTGPNGVMGKVTRAVSLFAGVVAVIIVITGGFMYVLSNGDSGKVATAKNTIIYAAVGLVVIAVGQSIIIFVIDRL
jgi:hypothetical protein